MLSPYLRHLHTQPLLFFVPFPQQFNSAPRDFGSLYLYAAAIKFSRIGLQTKQAFDFLFLLSMAFIISYPLAILTLELPTLSYSPHAAPALPVAPYCTHFSIRPSSYPQQTLEPAKPQSNPPAYMRSPSHAVICKEDLIFYFFYVASSHTAKPLPIFFTQHQFQIHSPLCELKVLSVVDHSTNAATSVGHQPAASNKTIRFFCDE